MAGSPDPNLPTPERQPSQRLRQISGNNNNVTPSRQPPSSGSGASGRSGSNAAPADASSAAAIGNGSGGATNMTTVPRLRPPRSLPPWIDSYESRYGAPSTDQLRLLDVPPTTNSASNHADAPRAPSFTSGRQQQHHAAAGTSNIFSSSPPKPPAPSAPPQRNATPTAPIRRVSRDGFVEELSPPPSWPGGPSGRQHRFSSASTAGGGGGGDEKGGAGAAQPWGGGGTGIKSGGGGGGAASGAAGLIPRLLQGRGAERGRKWDHLRSAEPVIIARPVTALAGTVGGGGGGGGGGEGGSGPWGRRRSGAAEDGNGAEDEAVIGEEDEGEDEEGGRRGGSSGSSTRSPGGGANLGVGGSQQRSRGGTAHSNRSVIHRYAGGGAGQVTDSPWRDFLHSTVYGRMPGEESAVVDVEVLDKLQPGFNRRAEDELGGGNGCKTGAFSLLGGGVDGRHPFNPASYHGPQNGGGGNGDNSHDAHNSGVGPAGARELERKLRGRRDRRRTRLYQRVWTLILRHPLVPLIFRLGVLVTSVVALAIAARIFEIEDARLARETDEGVDHSSAAAERSQAIVAIVIDTVAIPYIGYMTWDEYTGKPLGLRPPTQKISLTLMDLFFIIFKSASTSLAFEALVYHQSGDGLTLHLSRALAAFMFVGLVSWTMNFTVNVFRLVEKLGGGEDDNK